VVVATATKQMVPLVVLVAVVLVVELQVVLRYLEQPILVAVVVVRLLVMPLETAVAVWLFCVTQIH